MDAHSYRPTAIRRDPSYRKPAPVYIPSPPSSPPPSSPVLSRTRSRPPLPHDWKAASEHAVVGDFALSEPGTHHDRVEEVVLDARSECHDRPTTARKKERIPPSPRSPRRELPRVPQTLKSPTPPLSAHNRKRRLPDVDPSARVSIPVIQASGSNRSTNVSGHVQAPERFIGKLEPLRYIPTTVERPRHHRTPSTTQPSFKTEISTVSTVTLVAPGSIASGTLRSHGDVTPEAEWQLEVPVFPSHNPMHVVKIPGRDEKSSKPLKPQPQITRRGSMNCWDSSILAIKDVLCHAFGGCFGASSR
ncbi:hypothetical protein AAF712_001920 [Marasmius tenuissimus]|uniref:Uncharacterized protein n=1 Tax=Marasmius tenuissimus TaxID=585030 RepID=A0ABR3ABL2_9AGAR